MQTAIGVGGAASGRGSFERVVEFALEAEKLGVGVAWSAEAWGQDAVAPLAYLAGRTSRMKLGTGIMQISARVPSMTAMTALTLSSISGGRFLLGLGASGPQVVEGLHGRPFAKPLGRMRETIEIVRLALRGEKLAYSGRQHQLPLPGGQGKALRLAVPPDPELPIYLATLSPKGLELTGELADGWLGTSFTPEHAEAHLEHLARGAARGGRSLADLYIGVGGSVGGNGAGGIGGAMAEALANDGCGTAIVDIDEEAARRRASEINARCDAERVLAIPGDVSDERACNDAVARCIDHFGSIDVLVNNAGVGVSSIRSDAERNHPSIAEIDRALWDRFFAVNVTGPMLMVRAALPHMREKGWGRIVNNTTSFFTMLRVLPYGASKSALESMSAIWAKELEDTGITVN
ncbi:MAG: LLM class flavin-dependent oxidoreductase, partial [Myxococcota bacterium]